MSVFQKDCQLSRISIAHTFYNQHSMIPLHLAKWRLHPDRLARYIIIDDGSPNPFPAMDRVTQLRVFRIQQDIPWNASGARNLAFHVADTPWVLLCDMDHVVTPEALCAIDALDLMDENRAYTFGRKTADGQVGCEAVIDILMHRQRFLEIGGYDEEFSGAYGKEDPFFKRTLLYHGVRIIHRGDILLDWYPELGATRGLSRNKKRNLRLFNEKYRALQGGTYSNGPRLRFEWSFVSPKNRRDSPLECS